MKPYLPLLMAGVFVLLLSGTALKPPSPKSLPSRVLTSDPADVPEPPVLPSPVRLAADGAGHLVVSDSDVNKVVILSVPGMVRIREFTVGGAVMGVAAAGGRVYVGNQTLGRIEVFDELGAFQFVLAGAAGSIAGPSDLVVDSLGGLLFAVDSVAKTVRVYGLSGAGRSIGTISGPGLASHFFQHPTGLTVDTETKEVFVSDFGDIIAGVPPRVLIFGYDGSFHGVVSGDGGAEGYFFSRPQGLAIGATGHILVVDSWLGQVVVLDRVSGRPVTRIGQFAEPLSPGATPLPGTLRLPLDAVVVGLSRDLYVVSNQTRSVEVFAEGGMR